MRWGPGPVFVHESIAATRRWQVFALRSFFVLGLLGGLAMAWLVFFDFESGARRDQLTIGQLASLGEYVYYAISAAQLTLVLIVAPAVAADAICLDRSRGNLVHMFVTDLSNGEIVLGKLAARLVPLFALVAATIPVLALVGLLGGIILEAIVRLTTITLVLAVFGCSLAMAFSVRAKKTHEVLMAVYGIEGAWVLGPILWEILAQTGGIIRIPQWFFETNPYTLAWEPYFNPGPARPWSFALVSGGLVLLSAGLVSYAVLRIRAEGRGRSRPSRAWLSSRWAVVAERLSSWRRRPSLDDDPVLWREWRRGRPSRLARVVWGLYIVTAVAGTGWGIVKIVDDYDTGYVFLGILSGFVATLGLLLVSLSAPTVLAEERVRGSLDVLLASPVSTERIVLAKWWGAFRVVPALCLLPAIAAMCVVAAESCQEIAPGRNPAVSPPLSLLERFGLVGLTVALPLAQGAAVVSVGLALATWIRRTGHAVSLSVASYAFVAFGLIILLEMGLVSAITTLLGWDVPPYRYGDSFYDMITACACPIGAQTFTFGTVDWPPSDSRLAFYLGEFVVVLALVAFALFVLGLTLVTFDRCVGRVPERPRRAPVARRGPVVSYTPEAPASESRDSLAGASIG